MDIKLNSEHDIDITNNQMSLIYGEDYVIQKISETLKTFRGECFLNPNLGIPYITDIMKKRTNLNLISSLFKDELNNLDVVESIDEFTLDLDNETRVLNIKILINGNIKIEETI